MTLWPMATAVGQAERADKKYKDVAVIKHHHDCCSAVRDAVVPDHTQWSRCQIRLIPRETA